MPLERGGTVRGGFWAIHTELSVLLHEVVDITKNSTLKSAIVARKMLRHSQSRCSPMVPMR